MDLYTWNAELTLFLIANDVVLFLYLLVGIMGNGLVLIVYRLRMSHKCTDDRYFIPSLAVLDSCACVVGASYALALNLLPVRFPGDFLCRSLWFVSQATTVSAGSLLIVIAIHRYTKVCRPFSGKWTIRTKRIVTLASIVISVILSVPTIFFYGEIEVHSEKYNLTGYRCGHTPKFHGEPDGLMAYNIFLFLFASCGIILITVSYVLIGKTIYSKVIIYRKSVRRPKLVPRPKLSVSTITDIQRKSQDTDNEVCMKTEVCEPDIENGHVHDATDHDNAKNKPSRAKRISQDLLAAKFPTMKSHLAHYKYSYMFMTITVVFVIAYLPRIVIMLLESLYMETFWVKSDSAIAGLLFLYRLYILNHVTNPFIYGFFDVTFRQEVKKMLCNSKSKDEADKDISHT